MDEKKQLIAEIKKMIGSTKDNDIHINENFLQYFQVEELKEIKSTLEIRKKNISQSSLKYLDEIYGKIKKDK